MKNLLFTAMLFSGIPVVAQNFTFHPAVSVNGYVETYYCYDMNKPAYNNRPPFIYSHNRHNEFNLNIGLIRAMIADSNYRASFALMAGTYPNANLANEPGVIKNIFEANAGIRLSHKHALWLDMGIFTSHIGFESAIGKDCWTLTRSIMADNTPYYESGAKLSYRSENQKWDLALFVLNGWQRIQRVTGNSIPSFGTQAYFKPNEKLILNSSTFIGTDKPDTVRQMRYFHNLYGIFQVTERFGITLGFDAGIEQQAKHSRKYNCWVSPIMIAKTALTKKASLSLRGEYYQDPTGVIIASGTPKGFQVYGYSVNFDYAVSTTILWRIEARGLNSKDKIFLRNNRSVNDDYFFTTAIAISF